MPQPPLRRTCQTWTWGSWEWSWVRRARMSGANQRSLNLKQTLAPEHTHNQQCRYTVRHGPSRHIHTHKNTQCGCGTNTNNMNSSALGVAIVGEYEDVCHWCGHHVCVCDCCWIAVLVGYPQGAVMLYGDLCMQDPYIVQLPGNTYTPTHTLNGSRPSLWGLVTFGLPHTSAVSGQIFTATWEVILKKTKVTVDGHLIHLNDYVFVYRHNYFN